MNYFRSLVELENLCETLYSQLNYIGEKDEFNSEKDKIKYALQKLSIAEIIQGQNIICVTGLQGVGKTSLMQNFYGLDFNLMNISEGRSETIPILISERKNLTEPKFFAWELSKDKDNKIKKLKISITAEEFREKTNSSERNLFYLEIDVPFKHINNENCSFLLLPGFEKQHSRWQELINFCVKTSDVALFATDYSNFVRNDNKKLLERVKKQFSEHSMIVAFTKSDLSEVQNEQEKSQVKEKFNLKDDQVILTGKFSDEAKNEKWHNELKDAIEKYNSNGNAEVVFEMLGDIKNEVKDSISEIEEKIDQKKIEQKLEKFGVDNEKENLSKKIDKITKNWFKSLKRHLEEAELESIKKYEDKKKHENWFVKIGKHIFGDNIGNVVKRKEIIEECLKNNCNLPYSAEAIALSFFNDEDSSNALAEYLPNDTLTSVQNKEQEEKAKKIMENIQILLKGSDALDENGNPLRLNDIPNYETYSVLAEIAVYNFGKIYADQIKNEYPNILYEIKSSEPANLIKNMTDSKKLGLGILSMAGLDFLPDQKFDILSSLATTFGISTGAMVGIFAGVMGISAGITMTRDINEVDIKTLKEDEEVIHNYYKAVYDETKANFDDAMEILKEKVSESLLTYQGVDRHHFALINSRSIIADIKDRINEMYSAARLETKQINSLENKIAGYIAD